MKNVNGTMTHIRKADKKLLEQIAKAKDWSQTTALAKAIRGLAEAERIEDEGAGELVGAGAAGADDATAGRR